MPTKPPPERGRIYADHRADARRADGPRPRLLLAIVIGLAALAISLFFLAHTGGLR